jgi:hypothetical protein
LFVISLSNSLSPSLSLPLSLSLSLSLCVLWTKVDWEGNLKVKFDTELNQLHNANNGVTVIASAKEAAAMAGAKQHGNDPQKDSKYSEHAEGQRARHTISGGEAPPPTTDFAGRTPKLRPSGRMGRRATVTLQGGVRIYRKEDVERVGLRPFKGGDKVRAVC